MALLNVESICRICLLDSSDMEYLFDLRFEGSSKPLETRIQQIFGVQLEPSVQILICKSCIEDLTAAFRFQLNIIRSTQLLKASVVTEIDAPQSDHGWQEIKEEHLDDTEAAGNDFTEAVESMEDDVVEKEPTPAQEPTPRAKRRRRKVGVEGRAVEHEQPKQNIICEICGSVYNNKAALWTHKKRHDGVRKYKCELCAMAFIDKSTLKSHMRTHTQEKTFSCSTCGRKFGTLCSTKRHERIHSGERPYLCTFADCGKSFSLAHGLARHILIHTGQKPYECKVCGDKFKQSQHLKTHQNIHLRESGKPYTKYVRPAKRRKATNEDTSLGDKSEKTADGNVQ